MAINFLAIHQLIAIELSSRRSVTESMHRVIDECNRQRPDSAWHKFYTLPYDDTTALRAWLTRVFQQEPPPVVLRGLWFGLSNYLDEQRNPFTDLSVCGSTRFDSDPQDNSWAVPAEWCPEDRFAKSAILAELYRLAHSGTLHNDAEYPLCLGYSAVALSSILRAVDPAMILTRSDEIGIAVGFDEGDFILLGKLKRDGLFSI